MVCSFFFYTNAQITSSKHNLQIINVNAENYPEAIFVEFTVTDSEGEFVPNLTVDDFIVKDNGTKKYGCKRLVQDLSELRLPVDVVFLVDNSGSMSEEQEKLKESIPKLLEGLVNKGDVRVALGRFGDSIYTYNATYYPERIIDNWAIIEKNNKDFAFSPIRNNDEVKLFKDSIYSRNVADRDGSFEPYYNVLDWAAQQDFGYRTNALKVFIMIGDESYKNQCSESYSLHQDDVASTLYKYGIQTFVIQSCENENNIDYTEEYKTIVTQTKGASYDINAASYDGIITNITDKIKGRYILRYCVEEDEELNECIRPHR